MAHNYGQFSNELRALPSLVPNYVGVLGLPGTGSIQSFCSRCRRIRQCGCQMSAYPWSPCLPFRGMVVRGRKPGFWKPPCSGPFNQDLECRVLMSILMSISKSLCLYLCLHLAFGAPSILGLQRSPTPLQSIFLLGVPGLLFRNLSYLTQWKNLKTLASSFGPYEQFDVFSSLVVGEQSK